MQGLSGFENYLTRLASCLIVLASPVLPGCAGGPIDYPRAYTEAMTDTAMTPLGKEVSKWQENNPGRSGFFPVIRGIDALGARIELIDQAERTIDAQYFLMKNDRAGLIFAGKLLQAADRGVRVRFLLDDIFTSVKDDGLVFLDSHPNIEIRLFNPVNRRGFYYLNYVSNFRRANRRMHNKSFIVDNQAGIVGGRNIAAEYFELTKDEIFVDFDMVVVGKVAADVSATFDQFWNHELSVPVKAFEKSNVKPDRPALREQMYKTVQDIGNSTYAKALESSLLEDMHREEFLLIPANAEVITDDPEKLLRATTGKGEALADALSAVLDQATSEVVIVTPYFIPNQHNFRQLTTLAKQGVRVVVFTNSLASTNHVPVHGAYSRYRKRLLRAGVEMHEARANVGTDDELLTLHTKAIVVDRKITFIGSLNIDPRSIDINTEMGILIHSAALGGALAEAIDTRLSGISYQLRLDAKQRIRWQSEIDGALTEVTSEPLAGRWRRFLAVLSKIIPERQL